MVWFGQGVGGEGRFWLGGLGYGHGWLVVRVSSGLVGGQGGVRGVVRVG